MTDENPEGVEQEIVQEAIPSATEEPSAEELQKAEAFAKKSQNDQDRNWKEARRKMQELEAKAKEQEELIKKLTTQPSIEDDELDKLGDEDIVTKRQVKKLASKMAEEIAHKIVRQKEAATVDERLQLKYPDFAEIVTEENIEFLKQNEPELAESLSYYPDPYKQGVAVYKLLKKAGVTESKDMPTMPYKEKEKAIKNGQKPVSVNAVTKSSAIGNASMFENGLTPELKASLLKEMREAAKRM